ncbi:MAG: peptidoglycan DD-metalloendopeptidase family protein, partial [Bacteroidetes bacterium]|nr:peptidoglycan DD-metalloendopeptidase family protein [Bacteroidota bacterium]
MRAAILLSFLSFTLSLDAQFYPSVNYPKGYFRNPLAIPISLSGNFGELRPNHYHMGYDIRTQQRVNLPVYAAADGYIAKIKIEPGGFGRAIYINHPNGYTTVYCHLNDFNPALEKYVKDLQYKTESWKQFADIPATLFPVKKGDFIAWSGTTGGSQAPHVHFEIRTTADDVNHNPAFFGLPLPDDTRPVISRFAVYDRTRSIYEQTPRYLPIKKTAEGYATASPVITLSSPRCSFAIGATDTHSGSTNANGIFEADLYDDGKPVVAFRMDNISYENTRNLNAHIDYKTRATGGPFLQQLFRLPGYPNSIYSTPGGDGALDIGDGKPHAIKIAVKDGNGNTSLLETSVRYIPGDSVKSSIPLPSTTKMYYPGMLDGLETPSCEFYLGEGSLYDSVHIAYKQSAATAPDVVSAIHSIGAAYIPLQAPMLVRIKPSVALSPEQRNRIVMQRFAGSKKEVAKVEWQQDWAAARFREMGSFQLVYDTTPPVISAAFAEGANLARAGRLVINVHDNLGAYGGFRALLDGRWLRFTNDKGLAFIYIFDEKCPPGRHSLEVTATDEAGNTTKKTFIF